MKEDTKVNRVPTQLCKFVHMPRRSSSSSEQLRHDLQLYKRATISNDLLKRFLGTRRSPPVAFTRPDIARQAD